MTQDRIKVLTFVEYYLPGFKAGGPSRTISNLVARLGDEVEFKIITRDRDLGDAFAYSGIVSGTWGKLGKAEVLYLPKAGFSLSNISRLLRTTDHDILYLNSLFNPRTTLLPLFVRRLGLAQPRPCIVAPRGELGEGALELKRRKKRTFLAFARRTGLYRDLTWQATSVEEAEAIRSVFGEDCTQVQVAPNLPAKTGMTSTPPLREPGAPLKVIFLGRVSPMKNLLFALEVLHRVSVPVELSLCGPKEDSKYWDRCKEQISMLPRNVRICDRGALEPNEVAQALGSHELLFLPTLGENFGHAIAEALQAGLPVLISDRTPWRGLQEKGLGADLPLANVEAFVAELERRQRMSREEQADERGRIRAFARNLTTASEAIEANRNLFGGLPCR